MQPFIDNCSFPNHEQNIKGLCILFGHSQFNICNIYSLLADMQNQGILIVIN